MPIHSPIDAPLPVREIMADETLMPDEQFRLIEALFVHDAAVNERERSRRGLSSEAVRVRRRSPTPSSHAGRSERGRADRNVVEE